MEKLIILFTLFVRTLSAPNGCIEACNFFQGTDLAQQIVKDSHVNFDFARPGNWTEQNQYRTDGGRGRVYEEHGQFEQGPKRVRFFKKNYTSSYSTGDINGLESVNQGSSSAYDRYSSSQASQNNAFEQAHQAALHQGISSSSNRISSQNARLEDFGEYDAQRRLSSYNTRTHQQGAVDLSVTPLQPPGILDSARPGNWSEVDSYRTDGGHGRVFEEQGQFVTGPKRVRYYRKNYTSSYQTGGGFAPDMTSTAVQDLEREMQRLHKQFDSFGREIHQSSSEHAAFGSSMASGSASAVDLSQTTEDRRYAQNRVQPVSTYYPSQPSPNRVSTSEYGQYSGNGNLQSGSLVNQERTTKVESTAHLPATSERIYEQSQSRREHSVTRYGTGDRTSNQQVYPNSYQTPVSTAEEVRYQTAAVPNTYGTHSQQTYEQAYGTGNHQVAQTASESQDRWNQLHVGSSTSDSSSNYNQRDRDDRYGHRRNTVQSQADQSQYRHSSNAEQSRRDQGYSSKLSVDQERYAQHLEGSSQRTQPSQVTEYEQHWSSAGHRRETVVPAYSSGHESAAITQQARQMSQQQFGSENQYQQQSSYDILHGHNTNVGETNQNHYNSAYRTQSGKLVVGSLQLNQMAQGADCAQDSAAQTQYDSLRTRYKRGAGYYNRHRPRYPSNVEDLTQQTEDLTQQSEDLTQQSEDLTQQTADLTQQIADLTQRNENLTQQSADLTQQSEDLTQQTNSGYFPREPYRKPQAERNSQRNWHFTEPSRDGLETADLVHQSDNSQLSQSTQDVWGPSPLYVGNQHAGTHPQQSGQDDNSQLSQSTQDVWGSNPLYVGNQHTGTYPQQSGGLDHQSGTYVQVPQSPPSESGFDQQTGRFPSRERIRGTSQRNKNRTQEATEIGDLTREASTVSEVGQETQKHWNSDDWHVNGQQTEDLTQQVTSNLESGRDTSRKPQTWHVESSGQQTEDRNHPNVGNLQINQHESPSKWTEDLTQQSQDLTQQNRDLSQQTNGPNSYRPTWGQQQNQDFNGQQQNAKPEDFGQTWDQQQNGDFTQQTKPHDFRQSWGNLEFGNQAAGNQESPLSNGATKGSHRRGQRLPAPKPTLRPRRPRPEPTGYGTQNELGEQSTTDRNYRVVEDLEYDRLHQNPSILRVDQQNRRTENDSTRHGTTEWQAQNLQREQEGKDKEDQSSQVFVKPIEVTTQRAVYNTDKYGKIVRGDQPEVGPEEPTNIPFVDYPQRTDKDISQQTVIGHEGINTWQQSQKHSEFDNDNYQQSSAQHRHVDDSQVTTSEAHLSQSQQGLRWHQSHHTDDLTNSENHREFREQQSSRGTGNVEKPWQYGQSSYPQRPIESAQSNSKEHEKDDPSRVRPLIVEKPWGHHSVDQSNAGVLQVANSEIRRDQQEGQKLDDNQRVQVTNFHQQQGENLESSYLEQSNRRYGSHYQQSSGHRFDQSTHREHHLYEESNASQNSRSLELEQVLEQGQKSENLWLQPGDLEQNQESIGQHNDQQQTIGQGFYGLSQQTGKLEQEQENKEQTSDLQQTVTKSGEVPVSVQPRILEAYGANGPYATSHGEDIFVNARPNPSATLPPYTDDLEPWVIREKEKELEVVPLPATTAEEPKTDSFEPSTETPPSFWNKLGYKFTSTIDKAKDKARNFFG
ncbi:uncharacterized protein LOC105697829 [Orussus abietinus]|uniref:uncharacterized protein LOC105697829 n=1 Tax=Orussus abietinus TaxID=222816 RepID=UPI0006258D3F|nr:uncharacterized protein LOC105697829 [Orussus abietinus]